MLSATTNAIDEVASFDWDDAGRMLRATSKLPDESEPAPATYLVPSTVAPASATVPGDASRSPHPSFILCPKCSGLGW